MMTDKSFEIKKVVLVFVLTTVVGTFLATFFECLQEESSYRRNLLQSEKGLAQAHFERISVLLDTRVYLMRKVWDSHSRSLSIEENQKRWQDYSTFLYTWNGELNSNLALTYRYFGKSKKEELYCIHLYLREIGESLEKINYSTTAKETELVTVKANLDRVNEITYLLNIKLLQQIEREQIGVFCDSLNTSNKQSESKFMNCIKCFW